MSYPQEVIAWSAAQQFCYLCYCRLDRCWPPASIHHLLGRKKGRVDELWAIAALCGEDHDHYHFGGRRGFGKLTMGMVLKAKRDHDPDNWNPTALERAYRRPLPTLERPPEAYMTLREKNRPDLTSFGTDLSPEAEMIVNDPHWPAHWWPFKFMEQGRTWWEVREKNGAVIGFVAIARGDTDVEACRAAVDRMED